MKRMGIDIGTTSVSLSVLDRDTRKQVKAETIPGGSFIRTDSPWEKLQNVDEIEKKVTYAVQKLLSEFGDIDAIGLTGQMHGILYVDQTGNCVSPLYTWQDGRGGRKEFGGKSLTEEIRRIRMGNASL